MVTVSNSVGSVTSNAATLTAAPSSQNSGSSGGGEEEAVGALPAFWFAGALLVLGCARLGSRCRGCVS